MYLHLYLFPCVCRLFGARMGVFSVGISNRETLNRNSVLTMVLTFSHGGKFDMVLKILKAIIQLVLWDFYSRINATNIQIIIR